MALGAGALALVAGAAVARADGDAPPRKPWLGVSINHTLSTFGGVHVVDTFDDTPASLCGMRAGDEILAIDGVEVSDGDQLQARVQARAIGDRVVVRYARVERGGRGLKLRRCTTTLAERIDDPTELLHRRLVDRRLPAVRAIRLADDAVIDDAALRGEVAVLAVFSTRCDDCAAAIATLAAAVAEAGDATDAGARVIAIAGEEEAAVRAYVQRTGLGGEIAIDPDGVVARYLTDRAQISILVVDHRGVVRFAASGLGPESTHVDSAAFCVERAARARDKSR